MGLTGWVAIVCEGPSERRLMERLIAMDSLCFEKCQIIGDRPYVRKEIRLALPQIHALPPTDEVTILRVGDTLTDAFNPKEYDLGFRFSQGRLAIRKACTKPEIEILAILSCDKVHEFMKSGMKPKGFLRGIIKKPKDFYDFLEGISEEDLIGCIKKYKLWKGRSQKEDCLADYLKR